MYVVLLTTIHLEVISIFFFCVDEFTRKIWIYILKEKGEVFERFVKFCAKVERQSGHALIVPIR